MRFLAQARALVGLVSGERSQYSKQPWGQQVADEPELIDERAGLKR